MHTFYGSKATPIRLFGEDTPELKAFYEAAEAMAPGPWELLQDLLASWNPYALSHEWKLPDGFDAKVKVMAKKEVRIEVDELEHATFSYEFYENVGSERGLSNAANMVHSMDAWILRSMHRRLNYNPVVIRAVSKHLAQEFDDRLTGSQQEEHTKDDEFAYYVEQYNRSTLVDATILPYINAANVSCLSDGHLNKLLSMVDGMLKHKPFELVTVHDEFKAHPNNLNQLRWMYREIMAEIADSNVLDDLLSQIYQAPGHFNKLSTNLGQLIRGSAYALC